jgi:ribosomal protein L5
MNITKDAQAKAYDAMKGEFGYKNKMQAPRLVKVVISTGVGKSRSDKNPLARNSVWVY